MLYEWISTIEAANISGYHIEHIRRLIRSGEIVARKWGKEWMVNRVSLNEYLMRKPKPGPKQAKSPSSN